MSAIAYEIDGQPYEGWFVPGTSARSPVVAIIHAWGGLGATEQATARRINEQFGYAAFAVDVYGKGQRGTSAEENRNLMAPLLADRSLLQRRLAGGLAAAKAQPGVDVRRTAAIGYCFGGLCALDMARAGHDVLGVASFHGLFDPAANIPAPKITCKVLVEHGWQDPMAKPEAVVMLANEMIGAGADWRLNVHGKAVHSFTNPAANNRASGTQYDAEADRRSFASLKDFLGEIFA